MKRIMCTFLFLVLWAGCANALEITSSAFKNGAYIPEKYSCKGEDISPPLKWVDIPEGTRSFALICDDPDAPVGIWIHWVIFNIPENVFVLQENLSSKGTLENGSIQGKNSWGKIGYGGPCPPPGKPHRYYFKLYALDMMLDLKVGAAKKDVLAGMKGHILGEAKLMGLFKK